ncbi:hypothetical protein [Maribacter sp. 2210JD10-5]|uniref:hypothetical protein n=1 Tax=Maribacter sp. 2210JD10-5 TaxID=3386272 RepID=UPI0039BC2BCD
MSCKIEFKKGTRELTDKSRECLAHQIEIWETNKFLREIGILPIPNPEEPYPPYPWPWPWVHHYGILDWIKEDVIMEDLYTKKVFSNKHSIAAIIHHQGIAKEALLNLSEKLGMVQESISEKLKRLK